MIDKLALKNIVILGCGISGMISALKLASLNISSNIIESTDLSNVTYTKDNRTTALTSSSKIFFAKIGLWNEIESHSAAINDIYVVDNKLPSMLHFISPLAEDQAMGYLIQNQLLRKILLSAVQNNRLIKITDKCSYQKIKALDELAVISLNNQQNIIADLVIICDGKNSLAKNYYFSADLYKSYQQHALTFNVTHVKNHEGTAVEHFLPHGPFAILPLPGGYNCSIVWTVSDQAAKQLLALDQHEFLYLVKQNFGSFLGEISMASEINCFPLTAYHTEQYFYKHLVLVADSAHVIHPLAGQGLNQGIKDIDSLAENIAEFGINSLALTKYEQQRKTDNQLMYLITDNFNKIFSNHSKLLRKIRQIGFQTINALPLVKNNLVKYAMGKRST